MPRPQRKHPVWGMYELLTRDLGIDHDTAMHRLWEAAPTMPVDLIVEAGGDMSRTLESLTGQPPEPYGNGGLPDARNLQRQITEAATTGQREAQQTPDPNDFNQLVRARAAGLDRSVTVNSSDPATAFDPADDFIRQRFAERS